MDQIGLNDIPEGASSDTPQVSSDGLARLEELARTAKVCDVAALEAARRDHADAEARVPAR